MTIFTKSAASGIPRITGKQLFYTLALSLLLIMLWIQKDFGVTWDEWMQGHYGKLVLRYLLSGGKDRDFLTFAETMYLYGGLFDTLTGFFYGTFFSRLIPFAYSGLQDTLQGLSRQDIAGSGYFEVRHFINALFGFMAIFYAGLTAKKLRSWRAACLTLVFLALSPQFLAQCMNNPKDIPFAAMTTMALYYMLSFFEEFPSPKKKTLILLVTAIAGALNLRIGGLMLIFQFGVFGAIAAGWAFFNKQKIDLLKLAGYAAAVSAASYFGGLLFWPYGQLDPIHHPLSAFAQMSKFMGAAGKMLFQGHMVLSSNLPWYYIPLWLGIANPLFFHSGLTLLGLFSTRLKNELSIPLLAMTLFAAVFPVAFVVLRGSVLYDGWRHFLFVYPPLVVLAAIGWDALLGLSQQKTLKGILWVLLAAHLVQPLVWSVRNHPNENVYFNSLTGGLKGANGIYETDYWGNSARSCSEWLGHYHLQNHPGQKTVIATNAFFMSTYPYLKKTLGDLYIPYVILPQEIQKTHPPDYFIGLSRGMSREQILGGEWPPKGTVYETQADGVTLCAVVDASKAQAPSNL